MQMSYSLHNTIDVSFKGVDQRSLAVVTTTTVSLAYSFDIYFLCFSNDAISI